MPYTAALAEVPCAAHERLDGSGYHAARLLDAEAVERVLAAAGQHRIARPALPAGLTSTPRSAFRPEGPLRCSRWSTACCR
jgi:hypothetical protein